MKKLLFLLIPLLIGCASKKKSSTREWNETERIQTTETIITPALTATLTRPSVVIDDDTLRWTDPTTGVEAKQYKDADTGEDKLEVKVPERESTKKKLTNIVKSGSEDSQQSTKWNFQLWWLFVLLGVVLLVRLAIKFFWK